MLCLGMRPMRICMCSPWDEAGGWMRAWLFQRGLSHGRVMSPITQVNSRFNQVYG